MGWAEQIKLSGLEGSELIAAQTAGKLLSSAVQMLGSPDNPGHAFASAFLNELISEADLVAKPPPPATQGAGPWSDADYRNGSDIESDNFNGSNGSGKSRLGGQVSILASFALKSAPGR